MFTERQSKKSCFEQPAVKAKEVLTAEDMQKIVDANEKLVKDLKDGKSSNRL